MKAAQVVAGILSLLVGLRSAYIAVRDDDPGGSAAERVLLVVHDWARSGFWLSLGAFLIGTVVVDEPQALRWFVMVPIGLASARLLASVLLSRS